MRYIHLLREQTVQGPLILVNPTYPIHGETELDLIPVYQSCPDLCMERRAAGLLTACIQAVGGGIVPVSGWRSLKEQQAIWDQTMEREGEVFTRKYVAIPGCSEHQTGLAIDLGMAAPDIDFIRPNFPREGVCGAFRREAASYGFIQRYQKEKEAVTSIGEEPWHFRYVGIPHAILMEKHGLCLEEYRDFIRERPRPCRMAGGRTATVSHVMCPNDTLDLVLPDCCYQLSGDNAGGFFLTIWGNLL